MKYIFDVVDFMSEIYFMKMFKIYSIQFSNIFGWEEIWMLRFIRWGWSYVRDIFHSNFSSESLRIPLWQREVVNIKDIEVWLWKYLHHFSQIKTLEDL